MSHSTKLALGGGGGGTLNTLTANIGLPAVPDDANNINIVGTGVIQTIVDPLAPNTIRIESSDVAATFDCDTGSAVPVAGAIDIIGTIAQIETTGFGSTVQLALADNINIVGTLETGGDVTGGGSLTVTDDIIAATGDISAPLGNATIGGNITASDLDITGAATIAGPLQLSWLLHGVLRVDDAGIVTSSDGENGQLLIGSSTGPSQWRSLTPGYGIQIIEAENSITLSTTDVIARNYNTNGGSAVPDGNTLNILGRTNLVTTALGNSVFVATLPDVVFTTVQATTITGTDLIQAAYGNIAGTLNAGSLVTTTVNVSGAITCDSLTAAANVIVGNDLTVNHDATVGGDLEVTGDIIGHEDAVIPGDLRLSGHPDGVLITDTTGFIDASNGSPTGTNGQILISGGARPTWHALESDDGSVAITYPGDNRINLRSVGGVPSPAYTYAFKAVYSGTKVITLNTDEYIPADSVAIGDQGYDANPGAHGVNLGDPFIFRAPSAGLYSFTANFFILFTGAPIAPTSIYEAFVLFNQDDDINRLVRLHLPIIATFAGTAPTRLALSLAHTTNLYLFEGTQVKIGFRLKGYKSSSNVIRLTHGDFAHQRMTYITGYKIA